MFSQWASDQDELFKFGSAPLDQEEITLMQQSHDELLVNVNPSLYDFNVAVPKKPKKSRKRKLNALDKIEETPTDYIKKVIHRDVERQRRQEMAALYKNLRSLIPSLHLEGKRSISDHIHGTVKYIRHQNKKIDELKNKRDELKELLANPSSSKVTEDQHSEAQEQPNISVNTCRIGMEITVSIASTGDVPLSRILNILILEGMSIKSCSSTRVNERLLHIIQSEVNEETIIDENELQKKLMEKVQNQSVTKVQI
ncbi:hypothetical protein ACH5RR_041474 [Cinchona calisaya]|uniref:BHLH domain-containing protein n=1 Tax=Cinchona calisaya TaxID=153742 RepID=A0ABD2XWT0_9GENT